MIQHVCYNISIYDNSDLAYSILKGVIGLKILHISDLHLGRRAHALPFLDNQQSLLDQIIALVREQSIDTVLIAGDVYDKQIPSIEATRVFDGFLTELAACGCEICLISGNHDSPERLEFGSRLLTACKIHICSVFQGALQKVTLQDAYGPLNCYMMPFSRMGTLQSLLSREEGSAPPETLTECLRLLIEQANINPAERNILMYHGFVLGGEQVLETSDSELQLGGMQQVSADVFAPFDYVALGHIHKPQWVKHNRIRYCGSLTKYSFSEAAQKKSVTLLEMQEKGNYTVSLYALKPKWDMRILEGSFDELFAAAEQNPGEDLFSIRLTDAEVVLHAMDRFRYYYPNVLELTYPALQVELPDYVTAATDVKDKSMMELIDEFLRVNYHFDLSEHPKTEEILTSILKEE